MKKFYKLVCIVSLLTLTLSAVEKTKVKIAKHTVKNGETLFIIAKEYHSTSLDIQQENNLSIEALLHIGQEINVPCNTYFPIENTLVTLKKGQRSEHSNAKLFLHTIKKGETLFSIARKYRTTMDEVLRENNLHIDTKLTIKQVLIVPKDTYNQNTKTVKSHFVKHTIAKNETLFSIAKKYQSSIRDIENKNSLKRDEVLKLGRILIIPKNSYMSKKIVKNKKITILEKITKKKKKTVRRRVHKSVTKKVKITRVKKKTKYSKNITSLAKTKLGRRYVWGASGTKNTYDCSSFTKYVYKKTGITLPRTSIKQSKFGKRIAKNKLKKGDLIFFDTSKRRKGYVNHVGIYLGSGKFIHASSAQKKVVISKLEKFYLQRYKGARRPL